MPVTVRIPPYWRKLTGRQADVAADGTTVGDVLADVVRRFPDLQGLVFGEDGQLARNIAVFLNRESINRRDGEQTPVAPGDHLMVVLMIAGG